MIEAKLRICIFRDFRCIEDEFLWGVYEKDHRTILLSLPSEKHVIIKNINTIFPGVDISSLEDAFKYEVHSSAWSFCFTVSNGEYFSRDAWSIVD